jgi:hypothetical protein
MAAGVIPDVDRVGRPGIGHRFDGWCNDEVGLRGERPGQLTEPEWIGEPYLQRPAHVTPTARRRQLVGDGARLSPVQALEAEAHSADELIRKPVLEHQRAHWQR